MGEKATYYLELKDRGYFGTLDKANNKLNKLEDNVDKLSGKKGGGGLPSLGGAFGAVSRFAAGLGLAVGAVGLTKTIFNLGAEMEQTRVSFTTFLGDAEKANAVISELNEFSNVTPFDNAQVIKAGKGLLAFGTSSEELIPTLKAIGDISAGTGKDFNELATIYGKARVAGTLYAEDINQLVEAGVPIMGEFAKALGTTEDKVKKMASEGKLKFKDLERAFKNLTGEGGLFFNLMDKQSQTVSGKLSTIVGKLQGLGIALGENLINPLVGPLMDSAINKLNEMAKKIGLIFNEFDTRKSGLMTSTKQFISLKDNVTSLVEEYEKLNKVASLSEDQQKRLNTVKEKLFEASPSSAKFDSAGTIQSIDTGRIRQFIDDQKRSLMEESAELLLTTKVDIRTLKEQIDKNNTMLTGDKFAADKFRMSESELSKLRKETLQLTDELAKKEAFLLKLERDRLLLRKDQRPTELLSPPDPTTEAKKPDVISSSITGSSPKNINLNIQKLVETINFNQQSFQQNKHQMIEEIKRALLYGLNDAAIAAGK